VKKKKRITFAAACVAGCDLHKPMMAGMVIKEVYNRIEWDDEIFYHTVKAFDDLRESSPNIVKA